MKLSSLVVAIACAVPACLGCGRAPVSTPHDQEPAGEKKVIPDGAAPSAAAPGRPGTGDHSEPRAPGAIAPGAAIRTTQEEPKAPAAVRITFNDTEYIHRWSQNGQHEFTPAGQEDLFKWTDMLTINVYQDVVDAEGLALVANKVLQRYKDHGGTVLRTDSVPRTGEKPAEHLIVVVLGQPAFLEAVQARFKLVGKKGIAIIYCHRVYGRRVGPEMSEWLKSNGPRMETAVMQWETDILAVADLLKEALEQGEKEGK
jgi:hypothetical protein